MLYRNKVIDGFAKRLAVAARMQGFLDYLDEVAIKACRSPEYVRLHPGYSHFGIDPASHIVPSLTQKARSRFYKIVRDILPQDYLDYGWKVVEERLDRPAVFGAPEQSRA